MANSVNYANYTKAEIEARKERFERDRNTFDAIRERDNALIGARRAALLELDAHHKTLPGIEISKFSIWADHKLHLEATIAAYDQALKLSGEMLSRAESAYKQSQRIYREVCNE